MTPNVRRSIAMGFRSVLFRGSEDPAPPPEPPACFRDLHLDQVVQSIAAGSRARDVASLYWLHLADSDAIAYRQEVARDFGLHVAPARAPGGVCRLFPA